jgi:repressor LexA
MNNDDIAKRVKETRKMRGLTQSDVAKVLDKTAATVSDMERGKIQISAADLFKISNLLNRPVEYFFGDDMEMKKCRI